MLAISFLKVIAISALGKHVYARISLDEAKITCGSLGVMDIENLPGDVDPETVRLCAGHPLGDATKYHMERDLERRTVWDKACYHGPAATGCTRGWCWKKCGTEGQWCWTAKADGRGDWITCKADRDCSAADACSQGTCSECGCGFC